MKLIVFVILMLVGDISYAMQTKVADLNGETVQVYTDGTDCVAWGKSWIPTASPTTWTPVSELKGSIPLADMQRLCAPDWKVAPNSRSPDNKRPIRNVMTYEKTKLRILIGTPCGDRASPSYGERWRIVPGGMAYCK